MSIEKMIEKKGKSSNVYNLVRERKEEDERKKLYFNYAFEKALKYCFLFYFMVRLEDQRKRV